MKPKGDLGRSKEMCGHDASPNTESPEAVVEHALVARARSGDEEAFRRLVERNQDRAYGLALRIVRSPRDAEEVAQDSFVRAWKALPSFRGEARFSTWLHRIVARCALDRAAALGRRRDREAEMSEAIERFAASDAVDPVRRLEVESLVAGLSAPQRAVVSLFYARDQSVREIARALDMPLGTVKTHLHRARAALRHAWLAKAPLERCDRS